jgi:hypothetical protein
MRTRLGALVTAIAALALMCVLPAQPAHAGGERVFAMPDAIATSAGGSIITCGAWSSAQWIVYPEGDAAITFGAQTGCTSAMPMNGTVALADSGGTAVGTGSCSKIFSTTCTVPDRAFAAQAGATYALSYTTSMTAPLGFMWTTVPPPCRVTDRKLTCSFGGTFTVL